MTKLGYVSALQAVELGRGAFFGGPAVDLPLGRSPQLQRDDFTPQFGFVGPRYPETRVLLIGINPGNGPRNDLRTRGDELMMPVLAEFAASPTSENFARASAAYMLECVEWPLWKRHCAEVLGAGRLSFEQIAYSNCLPWRTESQSKFESSVAEKTAALYVRPLLHELAPSVVIALGKRAAEILKMAGLIPGTLIVWNRSQAATSSVKNERAAAAARVMKLLSV
jgi:hypothetical protein